MKVHVGRDDSKRACLLRDGDDGKRVFVACTMAEAADVVNGLLDDLTARTRERDEARAEAEKMRRTLEIFGSVLGVRVS